MDIKRIGVSFEINYEFFSYDIRFKLLVVDTLIFGIR